MATPRATAFRMLAVAVAVVAVIAGLLVWGLSAPDQATGAPPSTVIPAPTPPIQASIPAQATPTPEAESAIAEPSRAAIEALPRPRIDLLLPAGLPAAQPTDALGLVAVPVADLTPAYADPNDAEPVLALESFTDLLIERVPARWAVVGEASVGSTDWVRVLVPIGRGALPSQSRDLVNSRAVWVQASEVEISPEPTRIVVDVAARTLTLTTAEGEVSFFVGVGVVGRTDTPKGLCAIVAPILIMDGSPGLMTSCQSETMDGFAGASYAPTAIHHGGGFDLNRGGAVSNGCVRVTPALYDQYLANLPSGAVLIVE